MSEQHIQSQDISVADVFKSFYVVPDYQREYVWEADEVEQLLTDIYVELSGSDPTKAPEYFIGSIVVCPSDAGVLELNDGQQRMTTLFLTLCAIRDHLRELGDKPPGALEPQIAATSTDAIGTDHFRYRLDLQYEDSGGVLVRIASSESETNDIVNTRSVTNIRNAYNIARRFLKREFREDIAAARRFYGYLTNNVKLIRIQADDVAKALKIFETINDRGVGLDAMDLLKNLLFMKASRSQFDELKTLWKRLQDTLYEIREKPLRFLRYFIFSRYDVEEVLREDEIYGWFAKNESKCGYAKQPLAFAQDLLKGAEAYHNFFLGNDHAGKKTRYLENMQLLGGKSARQHLIVLLAGRHLTDPLFNRLCQEVENLFFCYVITREPTRDFERNFAMWARELRAIRSDSDLENFVQRRFAKAKADLSNRFTDAMGRLTTDDLQFYRLLYVLAKLTQYIELLAYGETEATRWLSKYIGVGYEIEHIYPQTPSDNAKKEFGQYVEPNISAWLGNLVFVEKSINGSLGNRAYSDKKKVYPQSQLLLTRSLAEKPKVGVKTKIDTAVAELPSYDIWNEENVKSRQSLLAGLSRKVWGIPEQRR
ncbi:MAG: DUF262 domain-containing protein [Candidatus Binatia bacterium]